MLSVRHIKLTILIMLFLLSGCSYLNKSKFIQDRDTDYLKARSTAPLLIPPGLSSSTIESHYPVSEKQFPSAAKKVDLKPPGL